MILHVAGSHQGTVGNISAFYRFWVIFATSHGKVPRNDMVYKGLAIGFCSVAKISFSKGFPMILRRKQSRIADSRTVGMVKMTILIIYENEALFLYYPRSFLS